MTLNGANEDRRGIDAQPAVTDARPTGGDMRAQRFDIVAGRTYQPVTTSVRRDMDAEHGAIGARGEHDQTCQTLSAAIQVLRRGPLRLALETSP